jgi:CDP-diglyceride synthetase
MLCPQTHLAFSPFDHPTCSSYLVTKVQLNFGLFKIPLSVLQIHALILATFASIIGPFGGFFASGLKRSIKIKVIIEVYLGLGRLHSRTWWHH